MGFAAPGLLWALAALAVPIAIHFWSRQPARIVRVGSVRLLADAQPARARRFALTDILLLLLRCLILLLVVLAIAGLGLLGSRARGGRAALVEPTLLTDPANARTVDSLRAAGLDVRALRPGLPPLGAGASAAEPRATDVWSLLQDAVASGPRADTLLVLAPRAARWYPGARPALGAAVTWLPAREAVAATPPIRATRVLVVAVPSRAEDVRVVLAALEAAVTAHGAAVDVRRPSVPDSATVHDADWIVVLGAPLAPALLAATTDGATIIADAAAAAPPEEMALARWADGDGTARLSVSRIGHATLLRHRNRFTPSAEPLAVTGAIADSLGALLLNGDAALAAQPIADAQRAPSVARRTDGGTAPICLSLAPWLLVAALLAFATERTLVARRRLG